MNCQGCGVPLPAQTRPGRRRKWCSDRCRKQTLYAGACEICGAKTNGYDGPGTASTRCIKHPHDEPHLARIARTRPKYERMAELWNAGAAVEEIAAEFDTTPRTVRAQIYRLRCRGWDVAHRRTEEQVRKIRQGRFGSPEARYEAGALVTASSRKRPRS